MNLRLLTPPETKRALLPSGGILQRKCACGEHAEDGECEDCRQQKLSLQRRKGNGAEAARVPPIVHDVLRSSGQALDAHTRAFMESRFRHDFSRVRVHNDAKAATSAQAINARAYTAGRDVVFAAGQYAPSSLQGRRLLAHELTHVVQQEAGARSLQAQSSIGEPGDRAEREADRIALDLESVSPIPPVVSAGRGIQRSANTCTYGEIRSWAITSLTDFTPPAGLGNAKASIGAACIPARCQCVDGSAATAPGDQHAWTNIVAATGVSNTGGGTHMCVGSQQCGLVHRCDACEAGRRQTVERVQNLVPTGTVAVTGKGTLYFYSDPLQGWCNAEDRRTACRT